MIVGSRGIDDTGDVKITDCGERMLYAESRTEFPFFQGDMAYVRGHAQRGIDCNDKSILIAMVNMRQCVSEIFRMDRPAQSSVDHRFFSGKIADKELSDQRAEAVSGDAVGANAQDHDRAASAVPLHHGLQRLCKTGSTS